MTAGGSDQALYVHESAAHSLECENSKIFSGLHFLLVDFG